MTARGETRSATPSALPMRRSGARWLIVRGNLKGW
jgi:hypothetical protein